MKTLENAYNKAVHAYIKAFEKKQDMTFDYWVGEEVGGIADFGDIYFFHFLDIKRDLDTNQPAGKIRRWIEDTSEHNVNVNYKSYIMGLDMEYAKMLLEQELEESNKRLAFAEQIFLEEMDAYHS